MIELALRFTPGIIILTCAVLWLECVSPMLKSRIGPGPTFWVTLAASLILHISVWGIFGVLT